MVMVEVEDGFEIPTLITDLVLDYRSMPAPSKQQQTVDKVQKEVQGQELLKQQQAEEARKGGLRRYAKEAEKEGVYMAFVPHEQQWLLTGPLDVVLVNHTPYEMLYTFTIKEEDKFANVDYGQVDKYEKIVIETISRDDLEYWLNGVVQAILTAESSDSLLLPLNAPFSLRPGRFFSVHHHTLVVIQEKPRQSLGFFLPLQSFATFHGGKQRIRRTTPQLALVEHRLLFVTKSVRIFMMV